MPRYLVQVLGPPVVADTRSGATIEFPAGKTLALLAYLILHPAPPLREQLYHLLWKDSPRERGLQSVRQALWLIRHTFGESALGGRDGTQLDRELVGSDVGLFEAAIEAGHVDEAERLWRGPFLGRFAVSGAPEWDRWVEEQRGRLEHEFAATLVAAGSAEAARGDGESAVRRYERAAQVEPYRLEHRLALIDLLLELHRGTDAEQALDAARSALPDPEFAAAFATRDTQLRVLLRDRAFEPVLALSRPELVGRAEELADLIARWNLTRRGQTQRILLHGRSGVGKTRLAEELGSVVEQDRGRVVIVKTTEPESTLPWATIATLVRRLLTLPGAGGVSAGSDAVLRRLVPSLARQPSVEGSRAVTEPAVLADALSDLIGAVAYEAPLLIVLDDGQWIDPGSWALLSRLLMQTETEPVLFLLTLRDGEVPPQVERALSRVRRSPNSFELRLVNLTHTETTELLTYILGSEQAAGAVGNRIYDVTRGNPLFIVETAKLLRNVGALRLTGDRWVFDAARLPEHFPLPSSIEQLLRQRVQKLSATAERIARMLAQRGVPQDIADLQPAGVPRAAWADAIAELVDHGVVLRTGEGYVLAHEQIAAVVRAGPLPPRRWWIPAAMAALGLLIAGAAAAYTLKPWEPLYGGGTMYFRDASGFVLVRQPTRINGDWKITRQRSPIPPDAFFRVARRLVDGKVAIGATMSLTDTDPYAIEVRERAEPRLVFRSTTDVEMQDISPTGDRFLLGWDNPATATYDVAATIVGRDGEAPRVVHQLPGLGGGLKWSPDGLAIAILTIGARDTLHVLAPSGEALRRYDVDEGRQVSWCPDGTILMPPVPPAPRLRRFYPPTDSVRQVAAAGTILDVQVFCGPDSRHALVYIAENGLKRASLLNLENGRLTALPEQLQHLDPSAWLPDTVAPVARELHLDDPLVRLVVGQVYRPRARVTYSDGSARNLPFELHSSDDRVVTTLSDGDIMALRPGRAILTARYARFLEDTTEVAVIETTDPALLQHEDFEQLDPARWFVAGTPVPVPTVFGGEHVLHLTGDGNFLDGVISRWTVPGNDGVTAELEFRLPLTRRDRQQVRLSICRASTLRWDGVLPNESADLIFPGGMLDRFSARQVDVQAFGASRRVSLGHPLAKGDWNHLAVQIRPDGFAEFVVNRRWVGRSLLRDLNPQTVPWRVCIYGASVETELLIRDLRVWRGLRYLPPDSVRTSNPGR